MPLQTDFLRIVPPDRNIIRVEVEQFGTDHFSARISGGWWIATAPTPKEAAKRVIELYEAEMGKQDYLVIFKKESE